MKRREAKAKRGEEEGSEEEGSEGLPDNASTLMEWSRRGRAHRGLLSSLSVQIRATHMQTICIIQVQHSHYSDVTINVKTSKIEGYHTFSDLVRSNFQAHYHSLPSRGSFQGGE